MDVLPVQGRERPAIEAQKRVEQIAKALPLRIAEVGTISGWLIDLARWLLTVIDRRRPQIAQQAGALAVLAVVDEDHIVAGRIYLGGDPALYCAQAKQIQAAYALVNPAKGPVGPGAAAERKDDVPSTVAAPDRRTRARRG